MATNLLFNVGATVLANALNQSSQQDEINRQIKSIATEVCGRMQSRESANRHANKLSVCGLYAHFFLSLVAVMECSLHLVFHMIFLLIMALMYYFVLCVSCGEWSAYSLGCLAHHSAMYGLYSGLLCGIIANVVRPWSPPLCGFYFEGATLCRPDVPGLVWVDGNGTGASGVCCLCCGSSNLYLPTYKIMQTFLFSFGGIYACRGLGSCLACADNDVTAGVLENTDGIYGMIRGLHKDVLLENAAATQNFYRQEYQCESFDDLLARRLSGSQPQVPAYAQVAPTQVRAATPVIAQGQPVFTQATLANGQKIPIAQVV